MQARAARTCKHARALKGRLKGKRPKACAGGGSGEFKKGRVCVLSICAVGSTLAGRGRASRLPWRQATGGKQRACWPGRRQPAAHA